MSPDAFLAAIGLYAFQSDTRHTRYQRPQSSLSPYRCRNQLPVGICFEGERSKPQTGRLSFT